MLELLPGIEALCVDKAVWGLTSLTELWLLAEDDYRAPWLVGIEALSTDEYRIHYRLPAEDAPWPGALVEGFTGDARRALVMIAAARDRCGGWRHGGGSATSLTTKAMNRRTTLQLAAAAASGCGSFMRRATRPTARGSSSARWDPLTGGAPALFR